MSVDANPDPLTVTVTPLGPDTGLSVSEDVVPVNVAVAVSLATDPVAVIVFAVPPVLNAKPFELVGTNLHDPPPPLAVMVHREFDPIATAMLVSVDANPAAVAVTTTVLPALLNVNPVEELATNVHGC